MSVPTPDSWQWHEETSRLARLWFRVRHWYWQPVPFPSMFEYIYRVDPYKTPFMSMKRRDEA